MTSTVQGPYWPNLLKRDLTVDALLSLQHLTSHMRHKFFLPRRADAVSPVDLLSFGLGNSNHWGEEKRG